MCLNRQFIYTGCLLLHRRVTTVNISVCNYIHTAQMKTIIVKLSSGLDIIGQFSGDSIEAFLTLGKDLPALTLAKPLVIQVVATPRGPGLNMSPFRLFGEPDFSISLHRFQYVDIYEPPASVEQQYTQIVSGIVVAPPSSIIRA